MIPVAGNNFFQTRVLIPLFLSWLMFLIAPMFLSTYHIRVLQFFFFSVGIAVSWNILSGFSGYWSFGHTLYIGVGAFVAGKFAPVIGLEYGKFFVLLASILSAGLFCAFLAFILAYPILRLRGIFFAIAMLGIAELTSELSSNFDWIGGAMGLMMPEASPANIDPAVFYYYIFLVLAVIILIVAAYIKKSQFGYGLVSIREDEDTSKMLGVPTERYKITASVISGALVGILGAVYGFNLGYFTAPSVFRVDFSLNMILYNLIGGIGTIFGPVIGAAILVFLTKVVLSKLLNFHILITGLLVIIIVLSAPGGIIGTVNALIEKRQASKGNNAPKN